MVHLFVLYSIAFVCTVQYCMVLETKSETVIHCREHNDEGFMLHMDAHSHAVRRTMPVHLAGSPPAGSARAQSQHVGCPPSARTPRSACSKSPCTHTLHPHCAYNTLTLHAHCAHITLTLRSHYTHIARTSLCAHHIALTLRSHYTHIARTSLCTSHCTHITLHITLHTQCTHIACT